MSERQLKAWSQAGLIDAETAERIRTWEAKNAKPLGLWALIGLGALAIGLGLVSVVAANWDAIPGVVRLSVHAILLAGLAGFIVWQRGQSAARNLYFDDAALFILAALGLTFFGHIGQVYQTSSPLWQPFLAWMLLFSPLLVGYGRGWIVAAMWMAGLCYTASLHWDWYQNTYYPNIRSFPVIEMNGQANRPAPVVEWPYIYMGIVSSVPGFALLIGTIMRARSARPDFWRKLEQLGLTLTVISASSFQLAFVFSQDNPDQRIKAAAVQALCLVAIAAAVAIFRPTRSGRATAGVILGAALMTIAGAMVGSWSVGGGILFMAFWAIIAGAALYASWRIVFQGAIAILAIRLIILSFELANDLLGSGLGLIFAGVATLGIAWIAVRVSKRYAPQEEAG